MKIKIELVHVSISNSIELVIKRRNFFINQLLLWWKKFPGIITRSFFPSSNEVNERSVYFVNIPLSIERSLHLHIKETAANTLNGTLNSPTDPEIRIQNSGWGGSAAKAHPIKPARRVPSKFFFSPPEIKLPKQQLGSSLYRNIERPAIIFFSLLSHSLSSSPSSEIMQKSLNWFSLAPSPAQYQRHEGAKRGLRERDKRASSSKNTYGYYDAKEMVIALARARGD